MLASRGLTEEDSVARRYYLARDVPWVPDLYFSSASDRHDLVPVGDNDPYFAAQFFRIYENGDVHYSQALELVVPIQFSIQFYPFETVPVIITIESYGSYARLRACWPACASNHCCWLRRTKELLVFELHGETLIGLDETLTVPGYSIAAQSLVKDELIEKVYPEGVSPPVVVVVRSAPRAGVYSALYMAFLIQGATIQAVVNAILTTTVLVLLVRRRVRRCCALTWRRRAQGGIPLWYETSFMNKMTIVASVRRRRRRRRCASCCALMQCFVLLRVAEITPTPPGRAVGVCIDLLVHAARVA